MGVVPSDFSAILTTGVKALFWSHFNSVVAKHEAMTTVIPTNKPTEQLNWLGAVPKMQEWLDERKPAGLSPLEFSATVKDYEASIEVDRNALKDDSLGQISFRLKDMAAETKNAPNEHMFTVLEAGTSGLCYDGKAFFADDHEEGESGAQDNLLTGSGVTVANFKTDLNACKVAMGTYKDDRGRIMDLTGDTVVIPLAMWEVAMEALVATTVSTGGVNIWAGTHRIIASGLLTDANDWYYLSTSRVLKPLLLVWRDGPNFSSLGEGSDEYFWRKKYVFGSDARYIGTYGLWQNAIKVVNT